VLYILELRKSHPQDDEELEGVVECYIALALSFFSKDCKIRTEPIDSVDGALEQGQETERDPVLLHVSNLSSLTPCQEPYRLATHSKPLSVIGSAAAEQRLDRVVTRNDKGGKVDEELAGDVEEDERKVKRAESEDDVDLWNRGLLLKVVQSWVLGELRDWC